MTYQSVCKYCGRGMLTWKQVNGKWRMVDSNGVNHVCKSLIEAKIKEAAKKKEYE